MSEGSTDSAYNGRKIIFYNPSSDGNYVSGIAFQIFPKVESGLSSFSGESSLAVELVMPLVEQGYRPIILSDRNHVEIVQIDKKPVRILYTPLDYERVDYLVGALCKAGAFDER